MKLFVFSLIGAFISLCSFGQVTTLTTFTASEDGEVYSANPTGLYGTNSTMAVRVDASGAHRAYIKFNIPAIPSNAVIYSAKLRLTPQGTENVAASTDLTLSLCAASWSEGTINYNNAPGVISTSIVATPASSFVSPKREFDVTAHVQAIVDARVSNFGWHLRRTNEAAITGVTNYYTEDNATNKPELSIQYYTPAWVSAAAVTHCTTLSSGNGAISPTVINGASTTRTYSWYNSSLAQIGSSLNITGLNPGWYTLRSYSPTYTGDTLYQGFLVGVQCNEVNVTIPTTSRFMQDAVINDQITSTLDNTQYNGGNNGTLEATSGSYVSNGITFWYDKVSLLRFSLWVDPSLTITNANLGLTGAGHNNTVRSNESELARITGPWKEYGVAFNNKPGSSTDVLANLPSISGTNNAVVDISNFFNYWKMNNPANYGMYFRLVDYSNTKATQKYYSTSSIRPTLSMTVGNYINCDQGSYNQLVRKTDAGFATTFNNTLKFFFTEEYTIDAGKKIPLKIYNEDNVAIAGIDFNGSAIPGISLLLPAVNYVTDKNFVSLSLSGLSLTTGKFYTLEFTNTLGEKKYLKFKYTN